MTRSGVLGGGQLARMIALAGHPLGITCSFLDPSPEACAGPVGELIVDAYDSPGGLDRLAAASDVVTFEFESVPAASAARLSERVSVLPPAESLAISQDRLQEKRLFGALGIETPAFAAVDSQADLNAAPLSGGAEDAPAGIRRQGPAGAAGGGDAEGAFGEMGGVPLLVEQLVEFDRELSIIARSRA